jgi:hypothetical protein
MQKFDPTDSRPTVAPSRAGLYVFEESAWNDRLFRLYTFTSRTSMITELCGVQGCEEIIKKSNDIYYERMGCKPARPRGAQKDINGPRFLNSHLSRLHASLLLRLHFTSAKQYSTPSITLARALDWKMDIYEIFCDLIRTGATQNSLTFDTYHLIVKALEQNILEMRSCRNCDSRFVQPLILIESYACPVCEVLKPNTKREMDEVLPALNEQETYGYSLRAVR